MNPSQMDAVPFAQDAVNSLSSMIHEMAKLPDGTPRDLDSVLAAGVLAAQGNLAIAGALLVVAQAVGRRSS